MKTREGIQLFCVSACAGDQNAFSSLDVALREPLLYSLCGWLRGRQFEQDREDLLQETMRGVFKRVCELAGLDTDSDILRYCLHIARCRWIDWLNKRKQHVRIERTLEPFDLEIDEEERRHCSDFLNAFLVRLTPLERQVVKERLDERSRREIAERLQISDLSNLYRRIKTVAVEFAAGEFPAVVNGEERDHVDA